MTYYTLTDKVCTRCKKSPMVIRQDFQEEECLSFCLYRDYANRVWRDDLKTYGYVAALPGWIPFLWESTQLAEETLGEIIANTERGHVSIH